MSRINLSEDELAIAAADCFGQWWRGCPGDPLSGCPVYEECQAASENCVAIEGETDVNRLDCLGDWEEQICYHAGASDECPYDVLCDEAAAVSVDANGRRAVALGAVRGCAVIEEEAD